MPQDKNKTPGNKIKSGKGRCLVIMHAITLDGPLYDCEEDGVTPIDDLKWKGDTCHPQKRSDGKLTWETLWVAQSHVGDYHDNMNSDMFMKWLKERLCPLFAKKYPGKKMVLITDNAPYHHAREIGTLSSYSKKKLLNIMTAHDVDYIDLPFTTEERYELIAQSENEDDDIIQYRGSCIRIPFDGTEQNARATANKPRIAK